MILEVKNVDKTYGKEQILHDVSFSIHEGEIVGLVGESGCGKSTLARLLCCYEKPSSGEVLFEGKNTACFKRKERQEFRRAVQLILQDSMSSLDPSLSIKKTLHEALKYNGMPDERKRQEQIEMILNKTLLSDTVLEKRTSQLSGGERQRVNICRALLVNPQLLICDEITSSLDVITRAHLLHELKELNKENALPMVFISHDINAVKSISDRIFVMYQGRIVEELKKSSGFAYKQKYTTKLLESLPIDHPSKRDNLVDNFNDFIFTQMN